MTLTPGGVPSGRSCGWVSCTSPRPATIPRPAAAIPPRAAPGQAPAGMTPAARTGVPEPDHARGHHRRHGGRQPGDRCHRRRPGRARPGSRTALRRFRVPGAALVVSEAARHGIALIGPLLADTSAQARAGNGYARADFTIDYDTQTVTCPQGKRQRPGYRAPSTARTDRGHLRATPAGAARPAAMHRHPAGASSPLQPRDMDEPRPRPRAEKTDRPGRLRPPG